MLKTIWICWLQGWNCAPPVALACRESWRRLNPGWDVRAIDLDWLRCALRLPDLSAKRITPTSFSDIARVLLLHEYGGVWVDATLLCRQPLDGWLPDAAVGGFFAFDRPGPDRMLSTWFLAADEGNPLVAGWCEATLDYWRGRDEAHQYFWFHGLFAKCCARDASFDERWARVPKISADGPHQAQRVGLHRQDVEAIDAVLSHGAPVTKLTYRHAQELLEHDCVLSLLLRPWRSNASASEAVEVVTQYAQASVRGPIASLSVRTENLGDHIQILASKGLVERLWEPPSFFVDRDHEIAAAPPPGLGEATVPIVLNGWFKTNWEQWPPHPRFAPAFAGFHIRPRQCPTLCGPDALDYYRSHGAIGCRDAYTQALLSSHGVDAYLTNCLSLANPRRLPSEITGQDIFVVSRDARILDRLPTRLGPVKFVSHYSGDRNFEANLRRAESLLSAYRSHARLIVTTLLHCALPAIAMGIPVVAFYPLNDVAGHQSDIERFSTLASMLPIHSLDDLDAVDWSPPSVSAGQWKLLAIDGFLQATARWKRPLRKLPWHFAPASSLLPGTHRGVQGERADDRQG